MIGEERRRLYEKLREKERVHVVKLTKKGGDVKKDGARQAKLEAAAHQNLRSS
jgi:rubrerythrin